MGSRRRFVIAWSRMEPAHPWRFLGWLIPIGIVHGGLAVGATWLLFGEDWVIQGLNGYPGVCASLILSAWGTGWLLRGRIAATRERDLLGVAFRTVVVGAYLSGCMFCLLHALLVLLMGDWTAIWIILFSWAGGAMAVVVGALPLFPTITASLLLSHVAVRLLHRAAGGAVEARPAREFRPGWD